MIYSLSRSRLEVYVFLDRKVMYIVTQICCCHGYIVSDTYAKLLLCLITAVKGVFHFIF